MWELGVAILTLAAVGEVVRRIAGRRRDGAGVDAAGTASGRSGPSATWVADSPLASGFPVERTPHERAVGDAAFVDGLIVGRYYLGDDREAQALDSPPPIDDAALVAGDDDGPDTAVAMSAASPDEVLDAFDLDHEHDDGLGGGLDDGFDDGLGGFGDGFGDGFEGDAEDDW